MSTTPSRFRNHPIRLLFLKSVWLEVWRNIKRAHKDSRARKQLLGMFLLVLFVVLVFVYLLAIIGTGAWFFLPFAIPIMWWRSRRQKQDFAGMRIAPAPAPLAPEPSEEESRALRRYFADLAIIYATLVDRAGSERFLKEKELPQDMEVRSRRVHLDLLRGHGIWEKMSTGDREMLIMPDGSWEKDLVNQVTTGIEPLRLLRWILRIDYRLPVIGQQLHGDFSIAHDLVLNPKKAYDSDQLAELDMVRTGRDQARFFQVRCIAEGISRGYQNHSDEKASQWARDYSDSLKGKQSEDLLLDDYLVSEANRDLLEWATALASIRTEFLSRAIAILEKGHPPEPPIASMFAEES